MDDDGPRVKTDEQVRAEIKSMKRSVRTIGVIVLAIGLAVAYWIWPSRITDLPLASITFGSLMRAIGSAVVAVAFVILALVLGSD